MINPLTLLNQQLTISSALLNPFHRSTMYKYKKTDGQIRQFTKTEKLTLLDFLWLIEEEIDLLGVEDDDYSKNYTKEQIELLKDRVAYQCVRYNVIDSIYKYMLNTTKIKKKTRMYSFLLEEPLLDFRKHYIQYKKLTDYKYVRETFDSAYKKLNCIFRKFYMNYFLIELNTRIKILTKTKNIEYQAHLVVQQDRFITYVFEQYKSYLPQFPLKNNLKQNFIQLFESLLTQNSWSAFIKRCDASYPEIIQELCYNSYPIKSNLERQTTHYIEQISIYISFILALIKKNPQIPIEDLCKKPVIYDVYFNSDLNKDQEEELEEIKKKDYYYAKIKEHPFSPIEIDLTVDHITLQDINRYIALLVEVENYFFCLLESIFVIILHTNTNSNDKQ